MDQLVVTFTSPPVEGCRARKCRCHPWSAPGIREDQQPRVPQLEDAGRDEGSKSPRMSHRHQSFVSRNRPRLFARKYVGPASPAVQRPRCNTPRMGTSRSARTEHHRCNQNPCRRPGSVRRSWAARRVCRRTLDVNGKSSLASVSRSASVLTGRLAGMQGHGVGVGRHRTMTDAVVRRALISVSDKTGLVDFVTALAKRGVEILSTGGTAKALR